MCLYFINIKFIIVHMNIFYVLVWVYDTIYIKSRWDSKILLVSYHNYSWKSCVSFCSKLIVLSWIIHGPLRGLAGRVQLMTAAHETFSITCTFSNHIVTLHIIFSTKNIFGNCFWIWQKCFVIWGPKAHQTYSFIFMLCINSRGHP